MSTHHEPPPPVRINARLTVAIGTAGWLLAAVVLGALRLAGHEGVTRWLWVSLAGVAIGAIWSIRPTPRFTGVTGQDSFEEPE